MFRGFRQGYFVSNIITSLPASISGHLLTVDASVPGLYLLALWTFSILKDGNMKRRFEEVECVACGIKVQVPTEPGDVAPRLTAVEALGDQGWKYAVDFYAMLTGDHRAVCPTCTRSD